MENKFVIAINRECGTGGATIARKLGELLGVKVYDRRLLDTLTSRFNLTKEEIEQVKARKKPWWTDFCHFYSQFGDKGIRQLEPNNKITSMKVYQAEAQILRELVEKESCVIVGRSAFHIFRDYPRVAKIFLIANEKDRIRHICQKYNVDETEAHRIVNEVDEARETFTKTFAGTSRYDARNYDLVINVSGEQADTVAKFLANLVEMRFSRK